MYLLDDDGTVWEIDLEDCEADDDGTPGFWYLAAEGEEYEYFYEWCDVDLGDDQ